MITYMEVYLGILESYLEVRKQKYQKLVYNTYLESESRCLRCLKSQSMTNSKIIGE